MGRDAPHALIVEDDPAELAGLAAFVATEGFRTSRASNLREARRVLDRSPPDLVLCDYLLPDGLGTELAEDLAALTPDVQFVLVTSSVDAPEVLLREHVPKPVSLRRVLEILDRARGPDGNGGPNGARRRPARSEPEPYPSSS